MTNPLIERANQFLSYFSLNRYVEKPLYELNLNQESMTEYLDSENLSIGLNQLNPFVSFKKINMDNLLLACFTVLQANKITEFVFEEQELIEILLYLEEHDLKQALISEVNTLTGHDFRTYDGILNCLSVQREDMPLGDQLPLTTFLQAYLCLIDKAKALKESL